MDMGNGIIYPAIFRMKGQLSALRKQVKAFPFFYLFFNPKVYQNSPMAKKEKKTTYPYENRSILNLIVVNILLGLTKLGSPKRRLRGNTTDRVNTKQC